MFYIYKITNIINNQLYIGKTNNPLKRWKEHLSVVNIDDKNHQYLHRAIKKYGKENFIFDIVDQCDLENDAYKLEICWILKLKEHSKMYNLTNGGYGGRLGFKHSEDSKIKMSLSKIGEKNPQFGKIVEDSVKKKISKALTGRIIKQSTIDKFKIINSGKNNPNYGKIASKDTRKKISESKIGEKHHLSKLCENDVYSIRSLHKDGLSQTKIAGMYNVTRECVSSIIRKKTWNHLP